MMGKMKFFLGFEIKQLKEGTSLNQAKYVQDMLKRFKMKELNGAATPMPTKCHLELDPNGKYCVECRCVCARANSTNVLNEGLRIGGVGHRMNSKVKLVKQGAYRK
jgi:hypothetical protein